MPHLYTCKCAQIPQNPVFERIDHSRIVTILNFQNLVFVQKQVSKETNTQNMLAKWLSTKTFRNHGFFKKYANPKTTIKGIEIWHFQSYHLVTNQEICFLLGNRAISNFQSYNPDCNNYFFKKTQILEIWNREIHFFTLVSRKRWKKRTNKSEKFTKFNAKKKQRSKECFIFYLISKILKKIKKFQINSIYFAKMWFHELQLTRDFCKMWLVFLVCKVGKTNPVQNLEFALN